MQLFYINKSSISAVWLHDIIVNFLVDCTFLQFKNSAGKCMASGESRAGESRDRCWSDVAHQAVHPELVNQSGSAAESVRS